MNSFTQVAFVRLSELVYRPFFKPLPSVTRFPSCATFDYVADLPEGRLATQPNPSASTAAPPQERAFSLIEVVIALGLFAFVIVPLLGLIGQGLKINSDSIQTSNLTEIYRHASTVVESHATSSAISPIYFTYSGEQTTDPAKQIYLLTFSNIPSPANDDAAPGLLSRKIWNLKVSPADNTNRILDEHFLMLNQDPIDALPQ